MKGTWKMEQRKKETETAYEISKGPNKSITITQEE